MVQQRNDIIGIDIIPERYEIILTNDGLLHHRWDYSLIFYKPEDTKLIPHRNNGPAQYIILDNDVHIAWICRGLRLIFDHWCEETRKPEEEKLMLSIMYAEYQEID